VRIAIEADRLFDGTGAAPIGPAMVLVEDGRITAVGSPSEIGELGEDVRRVAYRGCTIAPGLIDCHVHLVFSAGADPVRDLLASDDRALMAMAVHNAQTALRVGVTTVKDLGGRGGVALALRDAIAAGVLPGPRILAAGPPITTTGGHCYWMGGEADSADDLRKKVRELVREGVDLIKVMSSGGRMTNGSNVCAAQYSSEQLTALVDDARRLNKTVAAHAQGTAGVRNAAAAGVNVIEHCTWVSTVASNQVEYDEAAAEMMARKGIFVDPTLTPGSRLADADPATLRPSQRDTRAIRPHVIRAHRRSVELGVEIAAGTDAGVTNLPLDAMPREIRLLNSQLGLSPAQAIRAATYNAARSVALDHDLGTLQPGRRADALIVRGNPLEDLNALDALEAVYRDGVLEVEQGRLVRS
jgi:imidazolonepropionase-like amidohydrolase